MVEFKLVLGLKDGKSVQRALKEPEANSLVGLKIGDKLSGDRIGFSGFEFEITGGSDYCGFPMRKDLPGTGRKRILITRSVGMRRKGKGLRMRRTMCGNTIHANITQVNLKVLKKGKTKLVAEPSEKKEEKEKEEKLVKKEKPKKEEKPKEKKVEPKKEKPKKEEKPKVKKPKKAAVKKEEKKPKKEVKKQEKPKEKKK